jgi:hypothetical protein
VRYEPRTSDGGMVEQLQSPPSVLAIDEVRGPEGVYRTR